MHVPLRNIPAGLVVLGAVLLGPATSASTAAGAAPGGNFYTRVRANDAPVGGRFNIFAYFLDTLDVAVPPPAGDEGRPLLLLVRDGSGDNSFFIPGDLALQDSRNRRHTVGLVPLPDSTVLGGRIGKASVKSALWWVPRFGERWGWGAETELRLVYGFSDREFLPLADTELAEVHAAIPWAEVHAARLDPQRPVTHVSWVPDPLAFDKAPEIKEFRAPQYPKTARVYDFRGVVRVVARIDEAGNVLDTFVLQSGASHDLNVSALVAVSKWTFRAGRKNNLKTGGDVIIPIQYTDAKE